MKYEIFLMTPFMDDVLFTDFVERHKIDESITREVTKYYRTALFVLVDGKIEQYHMDMGEPEDNSFNRDWSWIKPALLQAYDLGRKAQDGK